MKPSGGHTHPSSDGSLPAALAVIAVAAIAVAVAGPVADAIATLLRAMIIIAAAVIAVAIAAFVALAVYRERRPRPGLPAHPHWMAGRAGPPHASAAPRRSALGQPGPLVIHLHLHGTSPMDVAEVLARQFLTIDCQDGGDRHATP
jgi:hypothetical protein